MDGGGVAGVGLVVAGSDRAELLELGEEVLDQVPPAIGMAVKVEVAFAVGLGWDHGDGTPDVEFGPKPVGVEGPVTEQGTEGDALNQGRHTDRVVALTWQQDKACQVAEPIDEGDDLGRQATTRAADGLILSPPFAPLAF